MWVQEVEGEGECKGDVEGECECKAEVKENVVKSTALVQL